MRDTAIRRWWAALPPGRVTRLADVDAAIVALALDPLPDGAPAVVRYRTVGVGTTLETQVAAALRELDRAALTLFPAWLPGAGYVTGTPEDRRAAITDLALRVGEQSVHFGPFLADLAARATAVDRPTSDPAARFAPEVRAAGLARVIAGSYGRTSTAMLLEVGAALPVADARALVAAAEWLAHRGGIAVWLTGPELPTDRVPSVTLDLPPYLHRLAASEPNTAASRLATITVPAAAGKPHPGSAAENALEAALRDRSWSAGREWNRPYNVTPLGMTFRLDLAWPAERCVVEVDGPEHRGAQHYESDRSRDVELALAGFTVLRFTNDQVLTDVDAVVSRIGRLVNDRRVDEE